MASRKSPSAAPSAPRAEAGDARAAGPASRPARGRLARFAADLDALIEGREQGAAGVLAKAATLPASHAIGHAWAALDETRSRSIRQSDLPATRVLLPAACLPPVA